MPRHSPYALTYFSLHGLHKYCAAIQAMSSILCYLAFYHTIHLRRALRGPTHPLLSNMSKNKPRRSGALQLPGETIPDRPAVKPAAAQLYIITKLKNLSVELQGFEPWTPALQRQCSSQLSYSPLSLKLLGASP